MRTGIEQLPPARAPMWTAAIAACLLAVLGTVAAVQLIPALYANVPDGTDLASAGHAPPPTGPQDASAATPQADGAAVPVAASHRNRVVCPNCGVIESIRQSGRSGKAVRKGRNDLEAEMAKARPGIGAASTSGETGIGYEVTVRFRDGSRTVLNEASPRAWQAGSRVIVIGRLDAPND